MGTGVERKNSIILATVLLAAALAVAGCTRSVVLPGVDNTSSVAPPASENSSAASQSPALQSSINSISTDGLQLSLSLSSTTLQPGKELDIDIDEQNTLPAENKVLVSQNWPMMGLNLGPCATYNYPFGIAIFQGSYSAADLLNPKPLSLYDPGKGYHCPAIFNVTEYKFQPLSDVAAIINNSNAIESIQMKFELPVEGHWTGNPYALSDFAPGIYTVAAGDEWGALAVLHFTVSR